MEPSVTKHLVFDYFAGKSTPMQKRLIGEWLLADANRETYYQWLIEWEHQLPQYLPELENKLEAYVEYLENNPAPEAEAAKRVRLSSGRPDRRNWFRWLVAATVLLFVGLLTWVNRERLLYENHTTGYNETRTLRLRDGSRVVMNANTTLLVPRLGFGTQSREVRLAGEANFSVRHTLDDRKFIVKAEKGLEVVVLGTEFTVSSRPRGARVVLNKGKVKLHFGHENARQEVIMAPGELVTLDQEGRAKLSRTTNPQPQKAWSAHRFVFEGTSLEELTYLFKDNFGLEILIGDEELKKMTLYGSFRAESAEQLLQELSAAANLRYEQRNDTIHILPGTR